MKFVFATFAIFISGVSAWDVDNRCLREGQVLEGDEVDAFFKNVESFVYDELVELEDKTFDWDDLTIYYREDQGIPEDIIDEKEEMGGPSNLRGTNQTSDVSRKLQSGKEFNLKLHWEQGDCWQDEWKERKWCMECRSNCQSGDVLEIQSCNKKSKQRFEWSSGRIKVAGTNMCLTNSGGLKLKSCSSASNQKYSGYKSSGGFQIKPSGSGQCLSQHHHPKAGEIIELESCSLAKSHKTDEWNVYWPSGSSGNDDEDDEDESPNETRNAGGGGGKALNVRGVDACTENKPCEKCEGDCDNDKQCSGSLKCFQRFGSTRYAEVPGCSGTGFKGLDFCY